MTTKRQTPRKASIPKWSKSTQSASPRTKGCKKKEEGSTAQHLPPWVVIISPHTQSRPAPTQLPRRPASETVQDHTLAPRMGAHPRAHRARAVVIAGRARGYADLHLKYEAAPGARLPRRRHSRPRARRPGPALDAKRHAQAESASVRGAQTRTVQARGVLQGDSVSPA